MRYLLSFLLAIGSFAASAQTLDSSEELSFDLAFESYFNNREYATVGGESGSDFAARLTPTLGWRFSSSESLNVGLDWVVPFGEVGSAEDNGIKSQPYYYDVKPLLYYTVAGDRWSVSAGLFPRSMMAVEGYSEPFFADDFLFYNNVMTGVLLSYHSGEGSLFELACDWTGQPSTVTRECFVIYSAGRMQRGGLGAGYNLAVTHFAGAVDAVMNNVVDNVLAAPYLEYGDTYGDWGVKFRVAYLQSLQQDRAFEEGWQSPSMWEMGFSLSRWGVTLEERLYLGDNLQPLYGGQVASDGTIIEYGNALYNGAQDFRTNTGYYNRAALRYDRSFSGDRVRLSGQFVTHVTGDGMATQQILKLTVKLGRVL